VLKKLLTQEINAVICWRLVEIRVTGVSSKVF